MAHWDPARHTREIPPIVGWHRGALDIIVNSILDNSYKGLSRLVFAPVTRLAYNFDKTWAIAAEEYADFRYAPSYVTPQQQRQLFGLFDYNSEPRSIEGGVGFGLTSATDHIVLLPILSRDLND